MDRCRALLQFLPLFLLEIAQYEIVARMPQGLMLTIRPDFTSQNGRSRPISIQSPVFSGI